MWSMHEQRSWKVDEAACVLLRCSRMNRRSSRMLTRRSESDERLVGPRHRPNGQKSLLLRLGKRGPVRNGQRVGGHGDGAAARVQTCHCVLEAQRVDRRLRDQTWEIVRVSRHRSRYAARVEAQTCARRASASRRRRKRRLCGGRHRRRGGLDGLLGYLRVGRRHSHRCRNELVVARRIRVPARAVSTAAHLRAQKRPSLSMRASWRLAPVTHWADSRTFEPVYYWEYSLTNRL